MSITNYGELKTAVADYINRANLTARIPDFISQGERLIYRGMSTQMGNLSLRCRDNLEKASLTPVDGVIAIPDDFRELKEVTMAGVGKTPISDQFYNRLRNHTGQTQVFSMRDKDWYQYPLSDTTDTFDIIYYADYAGTLVDDSDTNPILTALPEAYLYAALSKAEIFIKNDSRKMTWIGELEQLIRGANADARRAEFSGASMAQRTQYREVQTTRTYNQGN
jgi:hypothetical protein